MRNFTYTYGFASGHYKLNKNLLGNKGVNLVNMARMGVNVPQGFIISSTAWKEDLDNKNTTLDPRLWDEIVDQVMSLKIEQKTFSNNNDPLLVSVRSGAGYSMPGMMNTILNVGLNDKNIDGLARQIGEWAAYDSYRRFIQMFGATVFQIHEGLFIERLNCYLQERNKASITDLEINDLKKIIDINKSLLSDNNVEIPRDPFEQLKLSIEAVFMSWDNPGARAYREFNGIPCEYGTAVVVQQMVFGNAKGISGTGVYFTRNPKNGENEPFGEILYKAQGEDVVSGYFKPKDISMVDEIFGQQIHGEIKEIGVMLEKHFHNPQDIEFTIENGTLWILQTRNAKLTGKAAFKIAASMIEDELISIHEGIRMITPGHVIEMTKGKFSVDHNTLNKLTITKGIPASYGVSSGSIALSPEKARLFSKDGKNPILIMDHIDPNDVDTLMCSAGVITTKGGSASHMAIIMRALSIPGIVGANEIVLEKDHVIIGGKKYHEGEMISFDGGTGQILKGEIEIIDNIELPKETKELISMREYYLGKSTWSSACYRTSKEFNKRSFSEKVSKFLHGKTWKSPKAMTIDLLNHVYPETEMISSKVIDPNDTEAIRKALIAVITSGNDNSPRTTHYPERLSGAPWAFGPNSIDDVEQFLTGEWEGKYGGFSKWIKDDDLEALIISKEPNGKMDPGLAEDHFSFTVSILEGIVPKVIVSINIGSPHLREFERADSSDLIMLIAAINPSADENLGSISLKIGENHLRKGIIDLINNSNENSRLYRIKKLLGLDPKKRDIVNLIEHNIITVEYYEDLIDPMAMVISQAVQEKVFRNWWKPPVSLPHLMCALEDSIGSSVLEGQGRFNNGDVPWCLLYGVKGSEEKEKADSKAHL